MTRHLDLIGSADRRWRLEPRRPAVIDKTIAISLNCTRQNAILLARSHVSTFALHKQHVNTGIRLRLDLLRMLRQMIGNVKTIGLNYRDTYTQGKRFPDIFFARLSCMLAGPLDCLIFVNIGPWLMLCSFCMAKVHRNNGFKLNSAVHKNVCLWCILHRMSSNV